LAWYSFYNLYHNKNQHFSIKVQSPKLRHKGNIMIRNQWYAILDCKEVKKGHPVGVTRMGEKLVAWRNNSGILTVMADLCPHRGVALSIGEVKDDCIQCPFHGFEYDVSGACRLVPANGKNIEPPKALKVHTYPTREAHGLVYIWWGEPREDNNYPPVPFFESITDDFVYTTIRDHWTTHYSRAIENQLDAVHLPFVHRTTIGAGNRTIVNGPLVREENLYTGDHLLNLWVNNQVDTGQAPLKAGQLPEPTRHPSLQFRFPNVWHNWISDDLRIFVAFAPIDEDNVLLYLRQYHKIKIPVLRQITNWFGNLGNLVIERQDKRVVITQQPKRSDLNIGEKLIPGDGPIIAYRKIRRTLIEAVE
jgi:phenylpropionate dioxygenase-like ring-hydroxylating dioxygenase large terminal subunit